jgi:site-specific recombinase XerD
VEPVSCQRKETELTTLSDALTAYRICARAEAKSPKTIEWISSSVGYFADFLGSDQDILLITGNDLRRFIIALQESHRYRKHPYAKPQKENLSPQSIETYARAVRAFFGYLYHEGLIEQNPMEKIKMPKVPKKVVPTFSEKEIEKLLAQPDKHTDRGFRDYALLLTFVDTGARLSEIANLRIDDVDLEQGYLKAMGKGSKERYIPFGQKVAKALLKYRLRHRPEPVGTDRFFLTTDGRALNAERVEKLIAEYGKKAGLQRCYAHKLRHTSSVMYLRNGGDPFSLQKKLGHTSLTMTRHYCNLADSDVRAQHLRYGVVDRLKVWVAEYLLGIMTPCSFMYYDNWVARGIGIVPQAMEMTST